MSSRDLWRTGMDSKVYKRQEPDFLFSWRRRNSLSVWRGTCGYPGFPPPPSRTGVGWRLTPAEGTELQPASSESRRRLPQFLTKYPLPNEPNGTYGANTFAFCLQSAPHPETVLGPARPEESPRRTASSFVIAWTTIPAPDQDTNEAAINPSFTQYVANNWVEFRLSETHLFSNKVINEIRVSGMRSLEQEISQISDQTQVTFADARVLLLRPSDGGGGFSFGTLHLVVLDALTWVTGRHTLNFGGEFRQGEFVLFRALRVAGPNGFYQFAAGSILSGGRSGVRWHGQSGRPAPRVRVRW